MLSTDSKRFMCIIAFLFVQTDKYASLKSAEFPLPEILKSTAQPASGSVPRLIVHTSEEPSPAAINSNVRISPGIPSPVILRKLSLTVHIRESNSSAFADSLRSSSCGDKMRFAAALLNVCSRSTSIPTGSRAIAQAAYPSVCEIEI